MNLPAPLAAALARVQQFAAAGHWPQAADAAQAATRQWPDSDEAWLLLGLVEQQRGRMAAALDALRRAHALAPQRLDLTRMLAEAALGESQFAEAQALFERIAAAGEDAAWLWQRLARCLRGRQRSDEAIALLSRALLRHDAEDELWYQRGLAHEDAGDAVAADADYREALRRAPQRAEVLAARIALDRQGADVALRAAADAMLASGAGEAEARIALHHALGRQAEARGDDAAAFAHWRAGNGLRRARIGGQDAVRLAALVETTFAAHPATAMGGGVDDPRPLLIVGMPRSGTTLAEQILAAHPCAHGAGELEILARAADDLAERHGPRWPGAQRLPQPVAEDIATRYLAALADGAPPEAQRLVDKQPYNVFQLGLLARVLPRARVVWCRRDPRDVAISIFAENFASQALYATDLAEIAVLVETQTRLMRHWQRTLALPILELRYEALVSTPEVQIRALLDFAGLDWDPACLEFHATVKGVRTPSRWQVRQPLNTRSIGRWRRWQGEMPEALMALGERYLAGPD
jgi:Tfp pilus assembly protein PilF